MKKKGKSIPQEKVQVHRHTVSGETSSEGKLGKVDSAAGSNTAKEESTDKVDSTMPQKSSTHSARRQSVSAPIVDPAVSTTPKNINEQKQEESQKSVEKEENPSQEVKTDSPSQVVEKDPPTPGIPPKNPSIRISTYVPPKREPKPEPVVSTPVKAESVEGRDTPPEPDPIQQNNGEQESQPTLDTSTPLSPQQTRKDASPNTNSSGAPDPVPVSPSLQHGGKDAESSPKESTTPQKKRGDGFLTGGVTMKPKGTVEDIPKKKRKPFLLFAISWTMGIVAAASLVSAWGYGLWVDSEATKAADQAYEEGARNIVSDPSFDTVVKMSPADFDSLIGSYNGKNLPEGYRIISRDLVGWTIPGGTEYNGRADVDICWTSLKNQDAKLSKVYLVSEDAQSKSPKWIIDAMSNTGKSCTTAQRGATPQQTPEATPSSLPPTEITQ